MSRTSVIQHPAQSIYHTLRSDYVAICKEAPDATCAALILDLFTYWTDNVLNRENDSGGWFYRSEASIAKDLFGIFGINKLRDNRKWLEQKFVESKKTVTATGVIHHYRLKIKEVQSAINNWAGGALNLTEGCVKSNVINKGNVKEVKEKDYDNQSTIGNRETSDTDLEPIPAQDKKEPEPVSASNQKPTPAQMKLLQALTRRWVYPMTLDKKGIDLTEMQSCIDARWVEPKVSSWLGKEKIRLTIAGKELKSPAKPKADPGKQEQNRLLADRLAFSMGVKPVGKDYGNYIKVARDLDDAGIKPAKFPDYVRYVRNLSARQGGWDVTVNSLTANGRMSEYVAKQDPNHKPVDPNAPYDMGRMVAEPEDDYEIDKYGMPVTKGRI